MGNLSKDKIKLILDKDKIRMINEIRSLLELKPEYLTTVEYHYRGWKDEEIQGRTHLVPANELNINKTLYLGYDKEKIVNVINSFLPNLSNNMDWIWVNFTFEFGEDLIWIKFIG